MPRYIDADDLRDNVLNDNTYDNDTVNYYLGWIDDAPTADVVPVVRGEWIEKNYIHEYANEETEERQYVMCGICGKQPPSGFGAVNFCHNCGADMRGSEERE